MLQRDYIQRLIREFMADRLICSLLSPTLFPNISLVLNFDSSGVEVKSVLFPWRFIASNRIL